MESSLGGLSPSKLESNSIKEYSATPMSVKLRLFSQIAYCLNQFHENGVIHGDIKGENMLVMNSQLLDVKIIDLSDVTGFGNEIKSGTTKYGDREFLQCKGDLKVNGEWVRKYIANPARDMYAFGMTIFYLEELRSDLAATTFNDFKENRETCNSNLLGKI